MCSRFDTRLLVVVVACGPMMVLGGSDEHDGVLAGAIVSGIVLGLALVLHYPRWWMILLAVLGIALAMALMLPASGAAYEVRHASCYTNLRRIALALHNYHEEYGCFPSAYIADNDGKPMHSWRALILPYLDGEMYNALYKRYDFNEPWDGPNNKKLLAACPESYVCPHALPARTPGMTTTSYVAVVGPDAAWPGPKSASFRDGRLHGKTATTVMVIEVPASAGIQWTEPRDLSLDTLRATGQRPFEPVVHETAANDHLFYHYDVIGPPRASVAFADGSAGSLREEDLTVERLGNLLTIGGCTKEDSGPTKSGKTGESNLRIKWFNCSATAIWVLAVGLFLYRAARSRKTAQECVAVTDN